MKRSAAVDPEPGHIILVGPSAAGKTVTGLALARVLNREYVDTDSLIVRDLGLEIKEIFRKYGEHEFRKYEANALSAALGGKESSIIATGGGTVLSKCNREIIHSRGSAYFLNARPAVLLRRMGLAREQDNPHGPVGSLLTSYSSPSRWFRLICKYRTPFYRAVASRTVLTNAKTIEQTVLRLRTMISIK